MKICFLGDAKSIHIIRWCEFFRDKGDDVTIITFRNEVIEGVKVIYLGNNVNVNSNGGNSQYLKNFFKIKRIIRDIKPDIVNAHYLTSYGFIAALACNKNLVVSTWGTDILVTPHKNIIYKKLTKFVLNKATLITSDSNFMSAEIIKFGTNIEKVITSPMGIEPSIFNLESDKSIIENKNILSIRTLNKNSNIDIIIRAFSILVQEYDDLKLTIGNDGDMREQLESLVTDLNLNDKIDFLGCVERNEIVDLLKINYLYVSIPTSDSTSVSLLEAMASGIFPVVSNIPANLEWINNNYNGFVIDTIDEKILYNILKASIENEDLINKASQINNKIIQERAIWKDNMNKVRNSYLGILNN